MMFSEVTEVEYWLKTGEATLYGLRPLSLPAPIQDEKKKLS